MSNRKEFEKIRAALDERAAGRQLLASLDGFTRGLNQSAPMSGAGTFAVYDGLVLVGAVRAGLLGGIGIGKDLQVDAFELSEVIDFQEWEGQREMTAIEAKNASVALGIFGPKDLTTYSAKLVTTRGDVVMNVGKASLEARRQLSLAVMGQLSEPEEIPSVVAAAPAEDSKVCPFCAETIKRAAVVCRYCNRDLPPNPVEQLPAPSLVPPAPVVEAPDFRTVRVEFGPFFEESLKAMNALPSPPANPVAFLREVCTRAKAGADIEAATRRVPLDWNGR